MDLDLKAPIVPAEGLGGLSLGVHVQEYEPLLSAEHSERSLSPDRFRWQGRQWPEANYFAIRYELPPIAVTIDARDGIVYELSALSKALEPPVYEGSFNGIKVGDLVGEAMTKDERFGWDNFDDCFKVSGVDGLAFFQPAGLSDPPEEWFPSLYIAEISVFLPERGLSPTINRWPPGVRGRYAS